MRISLQPIPLLVGLGSLLIACGGIPTHKNIYDLYELRPATVQPGVVVPIDNDYYYTPPATNSGCSTIAEAPSCGGA